MALHLTADRELLRSTMSRYIEDRCPLGEVRRLAAGSDGLPPGYLRDAAALGWFAMLVPEEHGGGSVSGDGVADAAVLAEERGRVLQPGPFIAVNVVADALATSASLRQRTALLPPLAGGDAVATWAIADASGVWEPGAAVAAARDPGTDGYRLSGVAGLVQDGVLADWFLVTARGAEGVSQFVVERTAPGVTVEPMRCLDITQRCATVVFEHVDAPASCLVGPAGAAAAIVERQFELAMTLLACETVGALDVLFESARRYAVDRVAFGRPIGAFQAVKHQLADMSLLLESGKAIVAESVVATAARRQDAFEIACMTKSWLGDHAIDIAEGCMQLFGGIAFTWEHDLHLFLRRIVMNSALYGTPSWAREQICRTHAL